MISIIIPLYNVEKYINQCLLSVVDQIFTDWECLLVDDGSTDKSGSICDQFAKLDNRFRVIHQENQGVSSARNNGLKMAKGEYVCFIDSDDWVSSNYLSDMLKGLVDDSIDMVVTGLSKENDNQNSLTFQPTERYKIKANGQFTKTFIDNVGLLYGPTAILYKKSIIKENNLLFPQESSFGEDTVFNFLYLEYVDNIYLLPCINYFYRVGEQTLSSHIYNLPLKRYEIWVKRYTFYKSKGMWNDISKENMYKELWAIIYDGIFSSTNHSLSYLRRLLSIEEISNLKKWYHVFDAPIWIKKAILIRASIVFLLYFKISKLNISPSSFTQALSCQE